MNNEEVKQKLKPHPASLKLQKFKMEKQKKMALKYLIDKRFYQ
jgi:hypothetical protein